MQQFLPELVALPLFPLLSWQGKRTRRKTPRLPEADGPREGLAGAQLAGQALRIVAIGESPVAGVGVPTQEDAITAQLARALSSSLGRPVAWQAHGRNGATAREIGEAVLPGLPAAPVDVALVCLGVNDTTAFTPVGRWRDTLSSLLQALEERCQPRIILLAGVPPLSRFPALPQPLRWVMGLKSAALDHESARLAASLPAVLHVPLHVDLVSPQMMASDGYHPSVRGCAVWARQMADLCVNRMPG
ncbi:SGNH/GDSL hydrolase family protein [Noviherbaspirillum galbum]|uniref:SGNH/GDSL hydrolase family protein n=1 Tax=Noviherbaspirillum galbum TaxID=2709383 RepID=A0A6B3SSN9_9BURK|nr:SGNH/GDSL hydrolase family protein [Noviherbaspirillum galbum]NEX63488.1 SGNH/GDSL hydrolase family protein [Noviherbaspirillum galbum]